MDLFKRKMRQNRAKRSKKIYPYIDVRQGHSDLGGQLPREDDELRLLETSLLNR
jgi:hypothetical protein